MTRVFLFILFGFLSALASAQEDGVNLFAGDAQKYQASSTFCTAKEKATGNCKQTAGSSGSSSNSRFSASPTCDQLIEIASKCIDQTDQAEVTACDYKKNKDMQQYAKWGEMAATVLGATMATNVKAACSQMKDMSQLANGALTAFKTDCLTAQTSCTDECNEAYKSLLINSSAAKTCPEYDMMKVRVNQSRQTCKNLTVTLDDVAKHAAVMMQTEQTAAKCDALTGGNLQSYCQTRPSDPMCGGALTADCSNATVAATSVVCICQTNPRDPKCGGSGSTNSSSTSANNGSTTSSGTANLAADGFGNLSSLDGPMGLDGFDPSAIKNGSGGGGSNGGAGRGVGRNLGGGDGPQQPGGAGKKSAGGSGSGPNTKVNNGYLGGSGGGFGGGGSSSSGGSGSGYYAGGVASKGAQPTVDLKQFLPGGKMDPSRGLAGISGPDGITGPNSDIWVKVNTRYQSVGVTMKP